MSLLDFAVAFGAGAADSLAESTAARHRSKLEEQRQANLARLKAQYKQEEIDAKVGFFADLESADPEVRTSAQHQLRARGVNLGGDMPAAVRTRENRINDTMRLYNIPREQAVKLVDGLISYRNDELGNVIEIDLTTGTARAVEVQRPEVSPKRPAPPLTRTEDLAFDPGMGTGALAAAKGIWNSTAGQFNFLPTLFGPETAAQQLAVIQRDAVIALATSSRPPVLEQKQIMSIPPKPMDWLQNPEIARRKLASFVDVMGVQYRADLDALDDPGVSAQEKRDLRRRVRGIETIISRVLTEEATEKFLNYDTEQSTSQELVSTFRTLFATQQEVGEIPEIPSVLIPSDITEDSFRKLLDDLGIPVGSPFILNGRRRIRQ